MTGLKKALILSVATTAMLAVATSSHALPPSGDAVEPAAIAEPAPAAAEFEGVAVLRDT